MLPLILAAGSTQAADISVTVTGLRSGNGLLRFALFDNPKDFPNGQEIFARNVAARTGETTVVLDGIAPGTYALALHHDENGNDKMDTGLLGIPLEGYGFSNDAPVILGPPAFAKAAFSVPENGKELAIRLVY